MKNLHSFFAVVILFSPFASQSFAATESAQAKAASMMAAQSKLYQSYASKAETMQYATDMATAVADRMETVDAEKSNAMIFCAKVNGAIAFVGAQVMGCEVMDIKGTWDFDFHFIYGVSTLVGMGIAQRDLSMIGAFKAFVKNPKAYGTNGSMFVPTFTVGASVGYIWGPKYVNYKSLVKSTFGGASGEYAAGFGGGLTYLRKTTPDGWYGPEANVQMAMASVLFGDALKMDFIYLYFNEIK